MLFTLNIDVISSMRVDDVAGRSFLLSSVDHRRGVRADRPA